MANITRFYAGGYQETAPAQNRAEQWSNGTQPGEPGPGYTTWDDQGAVTGSRALTTDEAAQLAASDNASTQSANEATLRQRAQTALATNTTFAALASPTNAQVVAQVQTLTKECTALIRLLLRQLDSTA